MRALDVRREMDSSGIDEVSSLLTAAWNADGARPLSDHLWLDLREGGRRGFAGVLMRDDHHDHLVAYCQISRGNSSWSLDLVVHPHHRYDSHEIAPLLIDEALRIVAAEGGGHVHWWVFEPSAIYFELAEKAGLHPGRELFQMRRPLPLEDELSARVDGGFTRGFSFDRDAVAWLDVNNRAFANHAEQGDWDLDTLVARTREPWFDADGFRISESDGRISGFCWTKMHPDGIGEIYVIAADPDFAGHGLGSKLTIAGLAWLAGHGATTGMLYVDTSNDAAVAMYKKLGFTPAHRERAFVGDVH